ncbi:3-methyl-2-oxobutanoate hydroxymethyltransferase [Dissulfurispira thermophila]|uniref:3-methyl-2-oxobutanoate hydroxymethyltransferase n=2 Tax=root TaxID=1 RepID=A0A7G1H5D7_9BACT|nr:3-methyl-2-oxobutanoate hydroxymethyltransferase [Dissulfurispira thermophila]BCB96937.1 3-methyl-2-oxobutanoate hydroxymethyltransferase [Dissulfurispira thermophila]
MKVTINDFFKKKQEGHKITMLTAYDYPFAQIVDEAGIDAILVGDSLAMVVQGLDNTLPVTMEEMIYHTRMVSRAAKRAMVVADMPYLSYQVSIEEAIRNAGRFIKEAGAQAVKIEGGREVADKVEAMTKAEIPVIAHIGLTPQAVHRMGGYKVQGRTEDAAKRLLEDAKMLQDAGAFSIILEAIPAGLALQITEDLTIPTIGIGAGAYCNGQVLVIHDVLGLFERFVPKFVKRYANLKGDALDAIRQYKEEVEKGLFPGKEQSF